MYKTINATHKTIALKFSKFRNEIETPFPNRPINLISFPHTFPGPLVDTTTREGFMRANLTEKANMVLLSIGFPRYRATQSLPHRRRRRRCPSNAHRPSLVCSQTTVESSLGSRIRKQTGSKYDGTLSLFEQLIARFTFSYSWAPPCVGPGPDLACHFLVDPLSTSPWRSECSAG